MKTLTAKTPHGNVDITYSEVSNQWEVFSGSQEAMKYCENKAINELGWVYDPKKKNYLWNFIAENVDQIAESEETEKTTKQLWSDAGKSEEWQEENLVDYKGNVDTTQPKHVDGKPDEVIYGYFEDVLTGKKFYNLSASYDAKLNIKTGEAWSIVHPKYEEINQPKVNELLDQHKLIDKNYIGHPSNES